MVGRGVFEGVAVGTVDVWVGVGVGTVAVVVGVAVRQGSLYLRARVSLRPLTDA
jgi:hypothetical protein